MTETPQRLMAQAVASVMRGRNSDGVEAFVGHMVVAPITEDILLDVLNMLGERLETMFSEKFSHGQVVAISAPDQPRQMGLLFVFAPFETEQEGQDYMTTATNTLAEVQKMHGASSVPAPATVQ